MSKRKVFIPDDIEMERGKLGDYRIPGDIDTETVFKLQDLSSALSGGDVEQFDRAKKILMNLFEKRNPAEKVKKLSDELGFVGTVNILRVLMEELTDSVDDTKNKIENQGE